MQKVKFLKDYLPGEYEFAKDSYRVIMAEDDDYYYVQVDLHSENELFRLNKNDNGVLFIVVERS